MWHRALIGFLFVALAGAGHGQPAPVVVGSKNFTESYVLAEIVAQLIEREGIPVVRRYGFGGTLVAYEALNAAEIDVYAEYTGTIGQTILGLDSGLGFAALANRLASSNIAMLEPFGFDNTYAIATLPTVAAERGLQRVSDLAAHPDLRFGFSHEFRDRADGWPGLQRAYALPQQSTGIEHALAYRALLDRRIDVTDAYSTDGDLQRYGLTLLDDDLGFFPEYLAVPLVRRAVAERLRPILAPLAYRLDADAMRALNAAVVVDGESFAEVARDFLVAQGLVAAAYTRSDTGLRATLLRNTLTHLKLTVMAVFAATLAGVLIAVSVFRSPTLSRAVLYTVGLMQTVPSIALLALLIPFVGVGQVPAIIALFLYSLLPIARNTITALMTIDPLLRRVATALGLKPAERLRRIYLPLALPHVIAGVRIAAVVSIGTATLAAFIGAGGLGEPIVTGLALNDTSLILQGAIPAATLAIAVELLFEALERRLIPAHLRAHQSA